MTFKFSFPLGVSILLAAGLAEAQETRGSKAASTESNGSPAAKASRCAGSKAPAAGCTGFELRVRMHEENRSEAHALPREPTVSKTLVDDLRAPEATLGKQSQRLLILELARLERLLAATPHNSPERPRLVRRLAEGYAELAALAAHEKAVAEERARRAKAAR